MDKLSWKTSPLKSQSSRGVTSQMEAASASSSSASRLSASSSTGTINRNVFSDDGATLAAVSDPSPGKQSNVESSLRDAVLATPSLASERGTDVSSSEYATGDVAAASVERLQRVISGESDDSGMQSRAGSRLMVSNFDLHRPICTGGSDHLAVISETYTDPVNGNADGEVSTSGLLLEPTEERLSVEDMQSAHSLETSIRVGTSSNFSRNFLLKILHEKHTESPNMASTTPYMDAVQSQPYMGVLQEADDLAELAELAGSLDTVEDVRLSHAVDSENVMSVLSGLRLHSFEDLMSSGAAATAATAQNE